MSEFELSGGRRHGSIDLNADLGEGCPNDRALLGRVTSASICCGAHAGNPSSIRETLQIACELGTVTGAHPGYPDREGFGRREQTVTSLEVERLILDQVAALQELASEVNVPIRFIKPHGALYNQAQRQEEVARGVVAAAAWLRLPLLGQPGTFLETLARDGGIRYFSEGFPDRRYRADGSLVPRSEPGAVLRDLHEVEAQVVRLVDEGRVRTLCIHGDEPQAMANADRVRVFLSRNGIEIRNFLD
jgi:5-oxoprolinase (ATP-hydrolysing) subunit A